VKGYLRHLRLYRKDIFLLYELFLSKVVFVFETSKNRSSSKKKILGLKKLHPPPLCRLFWVFKIENFMLIYALVDNHASILSSPKMPMESKEA
jgi:hypothetical protein